MPSSFSSLVERSPLSHHLEVGADSEAKMEDRTSPAAAGFLGSSDGLPTSEQEDRARPLPSASVRAPGGASDEASEASDDISILGYPFSILETMELPKFVKQHNNSLTFPQKVSYEKLLVKRDLSWRSRFSHGFCHRSIPNSS